MIRILRHHRHVAPFLKKIQERAPTVNVSKLSFNLIAAVHLILLITFFIMKRQQKIVHALSETARHGKLLLALKHVAKK